ncbi:hypothetical protein V8C34DRAFT_31454 [Trichoderma compactum]
MLCDGRCMCVIRRDVSLQGEAGRYAMPRGGFNGYLQMGDADENQSIELENACTHLVQACACIVCMCLCLARGTVVQPGSGIDMDMADASPFPSSVFFFVKNI